MTLTVHFNPVLMIGLCLIPVSFAVAVLMLHLFRSREIGAFGPAGVAFFGLLGTGVVLVLIGIGMNIH